MFSVPKDNGSQIDRTTVWQRERQTTMRMVTGGILIAAAEQAFAHAHSIGFPHSIFAGQVLLPASLVLLLAGLAFLIWGVITERK